VAFVLRMLLIPILAMHCRMQHIFAFTIAYNVHADDAYKKRMKPAWETASDQQGYLFMALRHQIKSLLLYHFHFVK